jgi:carboxymethylenebutenolidase
VVNYVGKLPAASGKVVVAGFCWGGSESFRLATNNKDLKAAFVFYGTAPMSDEELARINCPVYGFYGGNDARVTSTVPGTTERMKAAGKVYEPVIYQDAGHGFMRAGEAPDASAANQAARDRAWQRWKELLKKT